MQATVIDPADVNGLEAALNKNKVSSVESGSLLLLLFTLVMTVHPELRVNYDFMQVSLFFTESPTNPFL